MRKHLEIVEKFISIQGETTYAGRISHFLRLGGCNLNCLYCDTKYSKDSALFRVIRLQDLLAEYKSSKIRTLVLTGGEPLLQIVAIDLMKALLKLEFTVMLETNGSISIDKVPSDVVKILDCKCPLSGESGKIDFANFAFLKKHDQVKFVISGKKDYEYSKMITKKYDLFGKTANILLSPVISKIKPSSLASWMIKDKFPAILNLQIHKIIWPDIERGV